MHCVKSKKYAAIEMNLSDLYDKDFFFESNEGMRGILTSLRSSIVQVTLGAYSHSRKSFKVVAIRVRVSIVCGGHTM